MSEVSEELKEYEVTLRRGQSVEGVVFQDAKVTVVAVDEYEAKEKAEAKRDDANLKWEAAGQDLEERDDEDENYNDAVVGKPAGRLW